MQSLQDMVGKRWRDRELNNRGIGTNGEEEYECLGMLCIADEAWKYTTIDITVILCRYWVDEKWEFECAHRILFECER